MHPCYNPERDGGPEHKDCSGCESLRVIQLYVSIARKKAEAAEGLILSRPEAMASSDARSTGAASPGPTPVHPDDRPQDRAAGRS